MEESYLITSSDTPDYQKNKHVNFILSSYQESNIFIKVEYVIEIWNQKIFCLIMIWPLKLLILVSVICMSLLLPSRQLVGLHAMLLQKWLLEKDITV